MNIDLEKKAKNGLRKDFFKLMNNTVLGKTMENVRKYRDIKLVTTIKEKKKLFSIRTKISYYKDFREDLLVIEMKKTEILMNKSVCFVLSILEFRKILLCEFWYDI